MTPFIIEFNRFGQFPLPTLLLLNLFGSSK
jgi:hypothetical protein